MAEPQPQPQRPVWRLRLARWVYPWWTDYEVDAIKWRAHQQRRSLGVVHCVEVDDLDFGGCCDMHWNYNSNEWDHTPYCTRCRHCDAPGPAGARAGGDRG